MPDIRVDLVQRPILAPAQDWLSRAEACKVLGIGPKVFQMMLNDGRIPPGVKVGSKTIVWHWMDLVAISQMISWDRQGRWAPQRPA